MRSSTQLHVDRPGRTPALIGLELGDITTVRADAIVNAANKALAGGGGVDGAIHRAAGPELMAELRSHYRDCPTGTAVITGSGRLAQRGVRWVVHAVGPVWSGGRRHEEEHLRSAYLTALRLADEAGATSVALPAISCGVYGYPLGEGSAVALRAVRDGLTEARHLERATFVLYSDDTYSAFAAALADLAGH
ncbi:MAG: macro domain-containing protein [Candidatus Limnocylindrales bacterium]